MTREEAIQVIRKMLAYTDLTVRANLNADMVSACNLAIKALEQKPCEDTISRKSIKQKLQEHHDFLVDAYGGFSNLPQNDKSKVDEITNCIAMVVNEPPVIPQEPQTFKWCTDCKEYDQEKYCCHRRSKVIRDTVEEMKQEYIEREVLDKIREEIKVMTSNRGFLSCSVGYIHEEIDNVFDKYKADREHE